MVMRAAGLANTAFRMGVRFQCAARMRVLAVGIAMAVPAALLLTSALPDNMASPLLENSAPHIGIDVPRADGIDGTGIKVAVIDTGVDYTHPDLFGWGAGGKVVGGYNFIQESSTPMDTNGHGTQVAGIIAANGNMSGIAPGAVILAYKVSEDGEGVSAELINRAIEMAITDGADIINISLGVNRTNTEIDRAVGRALENGVFVVVAAGNDGPEASSIGSPGRSPGLLTVGATYNNIASSTVATLDVEGVSHTVVPMNDSPTADEPISGRLVNAGYGRADDVSELDLSGAIAVVERGSNIDGEMLFFSIKEGNVADAGAVAMIVYNNTPGMFLGELMHEFNEPGYSPRIPTVSMERQDGLALAEIADGKKAGTMRLFHNPDYVAHFSSRGPVSPFYIKPEIVAPGAYINTTQSGMGYNFTTGTSYAAPHVSGAAALLLQKNPGLSSGEMRSIILTTADPVTDEYGNPFSVLDAGSGRLNIAEAYETDLIVTPPNFVVGTSSYDRDVEASITLDAVSGILGPVSARHDAPEQIGIRQSMDGNVMRLDISYSGDQDGLHEGKILLAHGGIEHVVPFVLYHTAGEILPEWDGQNLSMSVRHPDGWDFAKFVATDSATGGIRTATATPERDAVISPSGGGEYWIEADITSDDSHTKAYGTIAIDAPDAGQGWGPGYAPDRPAGMLVGIILIIGTAGIAAGFIRPQGRH